MVNKKTSIHAASSAAGKSVQSHESSLSEEEMSTETPRSSRPSTGKNDANTTANNKRKPKSRDSSARTKSATQNEQKGLDGKYWNDLATDRRTSRAKVNYRKLEGYFNSEDSLSEATTNALSRSSSSSSSSSSSEEESDVLYKRKTFVTCRNDYNSFYLCQLVQPALVDAVQVPVRWCSVVGEQGDDTKISTTTRFKLDYKDVISPSTILTKVSNIVYNIDNTMSLTKSDIDKTKRLLNNSGDDDSSSSEDDQMDASNGDQQMKKKTSFKYVKTTDKSDANSSDSESSAENPSETKKRKRAPKKTKSSKQPAKKGTRKSPGNAAKKRKTKGNSEKSGDENGSSKSKKKEKPVKISKTQLFKVLSNRLLKENSAITEYKKEPFFETNISVPFISSYVQGKLAIRAVLTNDSKLLKSLINDVDHVCSVHITRGLFNELTALHYATRNNNVNMVKTLLDDIKTPKKNRCPAPTVSVIQQSTGRANVRMLGFRTAPLMASRGAKEGNNALTKDNMNVPTYINGNEIIMDALKNNCSQEVYDLLCKHFGTPNQHVYDNLHRIIQAGHRKLAANIIGDIKDDMFNGFNFLHHQVLLYDNEDITINRASSVIKKTRSNFMITPIHCAAINPNAKYLKQLLNMMPEYNILDKYERRPIHFAAACEGPDPLEYLLSKQVNFNDVDRGGNSPLHIAAMYGRAANAELLLRTAKEKSESIDAEDLVINQKFGLASMNRMNKSRFYPLHLAVLNNHLDCLKVLLEFDVDINVCTSTASGKLTPLMLACQKGHLRIVQFLIENGARVESRDRFKRTPLIHACMCGNADVVSYLLRLGANPNVFDSSLNTALHYAVAYGWYFCVRLLIEAGADLNAVNSWQTTSLGIGFLKGHFGLCDYLLNDHGVDINFKNEDGLTLVMLTVGLEVTSSSVEQLEYVVKKHKADCTIVDANGNNALHYLAGNLSEQNSAYIGEDAKKALQTNFGKMVKVLLDNKCDPNKVNSKSQTPLMIALEAGNLILVDYLINKAKINFTADTSHDGKTLLHYFARQCHKHELIQTLFKLPINDEIRKMGKIFDNNGRTPFHYSVTKFDEFCQRFKSSKYTDKLKQSYQSIVQMIEYCLESAQCDPDAEIKTAEDIKKSENDESDDEEYSTTEDEDNDKNEDENEDEEEEEEEEEENNENVQTNDDISPMDTETIDLKLKETSIFFLLRSVSFIDKTVKHPLETFLKKAKKLNVQHHKTHRTPLLEAIFLRQNETAQMLINHSLCDVNLSTSNVLSEREKTPLILASKLQLLPVVRSLLEHKQCNITSFDHEKNQAIHYYLKTSTRTTEYLDILKIFVKKLNLKEKNALNVCGKHQRTPLHIAVYHNLGTIDAIIDIEKVLIENGSQLMLEDDLGNIPLHNVFLNKKVGDDPVELCVLIMKAMNYKSIDKTNKDGNTPLHLAVEKCSTVCVMLLQQHHASLAVENNLSNSIVGTCIASSHINLFITFLQQTFDINLGKIHKIPVEKSSPTSSEDNTTTNQSYFGARRNPFYQQLAGAPRKKLVTKNDKSLKKDKSSKKDKDEAWKWNYLDITDSKEFNEHALINLIIERDWQGALSLILNDMNRFHLTYIQIIEAAVLNNKLNLVYRLLLRLKDEVTIETENSRKQNLFHLIANVDEYDENLLKQILQFLYEIDIDWNKPDEYGSYPMHYACAKQNFIFINFIKEKYPKMFDLSKTDGFGNTAYGLLFWSLPYKKSFDFVQLRGLIKTGSQLDCLCNYDNEIVMDPLSFGYLDPSIQSRPYPPNKTNHTKVSPLIHAIVNNNFDLAKLILKFQADLNFSDENKRTPMMHAVIKNNIQLVKLLLNVNYSPDDEQETATAIVTRGPRIVKTARRKRFYLGARKAKPSCRVTTNRNKTKNFKKTSSINLNATDSHGNTCIHYLVEPFTDSSYTNNIDLLHILHSCGATLTIANNDNLTPLDYAIQIKCEHLSNELAKLTRSNLNHNKISKRKFEINDPNKKLSDKTDFYKDAQNFINDYILKHPPKKIESEYKVDPLSGMSLTGEIMIDAENNEPYDIRLAKTDVSYGTHGLYNFYRMQIIKHKSKNNLYFLFTRWGRIGDNEGQHQLTPYSTYDECRKEFLKVFREKTGNVWKDIDQFESKPKKYSLVRLDDHETNKASNVWIDFDKLAAENEQAPSQLQSSAYKTFLRTLINRQAFRRSIRRTQLDVSWMPVSQLKRETLEKARNALIKLKECLKKRDEFKAENPTPKSSDAKNELKSILDSIYKNTNEYYTLIPLNGYADEKLAVIDNDDLLKAQEKVLDDLYELELSYKMLLGAQANIKSISPLDYLYKSMNCQMQALLKDDLDSQLILRYIWASAPEIRVEQIFKIAVPGENERLEKCNLSNHNLLWHGTGVCNLMSILTRGLLSGTLVATATGSLFGTGIYTADTFKKSLGYCYGVADTNGERCFMLLCEVALGKMKEVGISRNEEESEEEDEDDSDDKPLDLKRYQSRKGAGRRIPDPKHTISLNTGVHMPLGQLIDNPDFGGNCYYGLNYNEYIVYDEKQVALRYLVQFRR